MNNPFCKQCNKPATLVDDNWVCHYCKMFISKKTEVYSRVVGYLRPVDQYNKGKKQEYLDRKNYVFKKDS